MKLRGVLCLLVVVTACGGSKFEAGGSGGSPTGGASGSGAAAVGGAAGSGGSTGGAAGSPSGGSGGGSAGCAMVADPGVCQPIGAAPDPAPSKSGEGCADGTVEGFFSATGIAACSGGWDVPGTTSGPECGNASGNTSANPAGVGCSVADLCQAGWHVCASAAEVGQKTAGQGCGALGQSVVGFFLTQQGMAPTGAIAPCTADGSNNLVGCAGPGTIGSPAPAASCQPLSTAWQVHHCACAQTAGWCCGTDAAAEASHVVHVGPNYGGALCCSD